MLRTMTLDCATSFLALACVSAVVGFFSPFESPAVESFGEAMFVSCTLTSLVALMADRPTENHGE